MSLSRKCSISARKITGEGWLYEGLSRHRALCQPLLQHQHGRTASSSSYSSNQSPQSPPPSRPHARIRPELPPARSFYRLPVILSIFAGIAGWYGFTLHATNRERLSSSVLKNVIQRIRSDENVKNKLGEGVQLERNEWLLGDPWIMGSVNMMQGKIDMSFRLRGERNSGKAYFTSIRRDQALPFETLRFLIVVDGSGETISLLDPIQEGKHVDIAVS